MSAAGKNSASLGMIRLGARLSLRGAREGKVRMILTAFGVALAVALLLFTLSGFNGLKARDLQSGWLLTSSENRQPSVDESTSDPLWWRLSSDRYGDRSITVVEVAATGSRSPLVPGLDRLPAPGEYYVSPALAKLLAATPADQLGARFAGTQVGKAALTSPDSLVAIVGRVPSQLQNELGALEVRSIETAPEPHSYSEFLRIALGIGAIGLMLPVLVFVITATRLAAARREERLAALRLVGATPGQVNVVAAVEAALAAIAGTAAGFVLFFGFRPLVALIPFTGAPFFSSDLSLGRLAIAGVALGVPVASILAGLWSLRRVQISPLGVTRKAPARRPRAVRLLAPLVAILLLLAPGRVGGSMLRTYTVFVVFATIALGIMIAGPWLTYAGGRLLAGIARRDSTLIAARRLGSDPRRAFRAISGLVLAVFMGTVFVSIIGTAVNSGSGTFRAHDLPASAMIESFAGSSTGDLSPAASAQLAATVRQLDGVHGVVTVLHPDSADAQAGATGVVTDEQWLLLGGAAGDTNGSGYVALDINDLGQGYLSPLPWSTAGQGPASAGTVEDLVVMTDGSRASIERVRTAVEAALAPDGPSPYAVGEITTTQDDLIRLLGRMVDVGMILCLIIAGCSLAVSIAGGLVERRRAFALLRLAGMPLRRLYYAVLVEAAVPLVLAAVMSAGIGFLVAALIIWNTGGGLSVAAPGLTYFAMVIGGLLAALAIVGGTLPLVGRITELQSARME